MYQVVHLVEESLQLLILLLLVVLQLIEHLATPIHQPLICLIILITGLSLVHNLMLLQMLRIPVPLRSVIFIFFPREESIRHILILSYLCV